MNYYRFDLNEDDDYGQYEKAIMGNKNLAVVKNNPY